MKLKIMTWNIWHGKYLNEVVSFMKQTQPDVVGLQEVIKNEHEGKASNIVEQIAEELDYEFAYCKTYTTERHIPPYEQGNAILSKFPIISSQCYMLSTEKEYAGSAATEPRGAIMVKLKIQDKDIFFVTTHLAYSNYFQDTEIRFRQVEKLLSILPKKYVILVGDFNSLPKSKTIHNIQQVLHLNTQQLDKKTWTVYPADYNGFKTQGLEYRIDYIFTSDDIKVLSTEVALTKASDHLPIISTVEI